MSDAATPPADDLDRDRADQPDREDRVHLDPHEQPNAPNRLPETEHVGPDSTSRDEPSDRDELDQPDRRIEP
jgi:hypothetical protein